jgi:ABC-2 type transport system ATP-binding protein
MEPGAGNAILARGVCRAFADVRAIHHLDLAVEAGAMFGLVGPDGAGKSTVIRIFCGLLKPDSGDVSVAGFDLRRGIEDIKRRIGYLSQDFTLYGDLSVDENIAFFARVHGVESWRKRREDLLGMTGLKTFRSRLGRHLSGGMKKKLALACTLVHTPTVLFLDEPSTGVDPVSRGEFWNLLSGMVAGGMTVFLTTPYLDEAERCDRIGLMHRGRILSVGTPSEIKARMPDRVLELSCGNAQAAYRILRDRWPVERLVLRGDAIRLRLPIESKDDVEAVSAVEHAGLGPVVSRDAVPTLDEAFVGVITAETKDMVDAA